MLAYNSLKECHQTNVPMINDSCDIDVALYDLRVFCDEVAGQDRSKRV